MYSDYRRNKEDREIGSSGHWAISQPSEDIAKHAATPDDLHNIIANGKGHMPKFGSKLTPEEIDALAHEVKALNVK